MDFMKLKIVIWYILFISKNLFSGINFIRKLSKFGLILIIF